MQNEIIQRRVEELERAGVRLPKIRPGKKKRRPLTATRKEHLGKAFKLPDGREFVSIASAARALGVHPTTLHYHSVRGTLDRLGTGRSAND